MLYSTAVHSTCGTIVKQPSPAIATHGRSGAASLAPSTPAAPKPMPEKPHELSMVCGRRAFQNCMYQLWLTPTSQARMASSGSTAWQSATTRSGRIGVAWMSKFGRVNSSQAALHLSMSACQAFSASPRLRRAPLQLGQHLAQEGARVGQDGEVGRIVAAELVMVDVDVDQLGVREVPGIARQPGRGRAVVEARADGHHHVGAAAGLVGGIGAVAADEAERQRVGHVEAAHAVGRGDDGDAQALRRTRSAPCRPPTASRRGR